MSIEDISKEIGIPESTIWSFRKRCIERDGDIENRKSPGRPKMSKKKREAIVECVKNNPFITKTWIAYELDLCPSSVGNVLKEEKFETVVARPNLIPDGNENVKRARIEFAMRVIEELINIKNVIFSDETYIFLRNKPDERLVTKPEGANPFDEKYERKRESCFDRKILIWACITKMVMDQSMSIRVILTLRATRRSLRATYCLLSPNAGRKAPPLHARQCSSTPFR